MWRWQLRKDLKNPPGGHQGICTLFPFQCPAVLPIDETPPKLEDKDVCGCVLPVSPPGRAEKGKRASEEALNLLRTHIYWPLPWLAVMTIILAHIQLGTPAAGRVVVVAPCREELLGRRTQ